jgi:hypothetical protein
MNQDLMLLPVIAMFLLTLVVGVRMLVLRIRAVRRDNLNPAHFLLNRGGKLPDYLAKVSNHYVNLFEWPVMFYVVCLAIYAGKRADMAYLALAWLFVGLRCAHAFIHMTHNTLLQRRNVFLYGVLTLLFMWGRLAVQVIGSVL